ncbi:uncharacterized protein AB675_10835 [Cyphellophora attinorum]|uniref:Uncharacterized protein n=1 Tax=Cyphellophora attinorum TaxID=1664694 RepID=A0A0N0NMZ5_9EURO|nr:uncharacterized protein AB675_10835 [Phialophora attinorum]KPI40789.1 hypothetical protein AB675_10835 [Phialophora attinorum]
MAKKAKYCYPMLDIYYRIHNIIRPDLSDLDVVGSKREDGIWKPKNFSIKHYYVYGAWPGSGSETDFLDCLARATDKYRQRLLAAQKAKQAEAEVERLGNHYRRVRKCWIAHRNRAAGLKGAQTKKRNAQLD